MAEKKAIRKFAQMDFERFKDVLAAKGLDLEIVANELGYERTIFANAARTEGLRYGAAIALEHLYGISPDDYAPRRGQAKEKQLEFGYLQLRQVVRDIIREELDKKIRAEEFREIIKHIVRGEVIRSDYEVIRSEEYRVMLYNVIADAVAKALKE